MAAEPQSKTFTVKHLSHPRRGHDPNAWVNKEHTITIIVTHSKDPSTDQLFVDHHHIHQNRWQWISLHDQLVWQQGSGEEYLAGHVVFDADGEHAAGSMQFGMSNPRDTVSLSYLHPSYSCDLSADAGAYIVKEGPAYTLKWDASSSAWKNATWVTNALTFTYWIEKDGKVGDQQLYQTAVVFNDNQTTTEWNVLPRAPGGSDAFSSRLDVNRQFSFLLNSGYVPPSDDRSQHKDGIKTGYVPPSDDCSQHKDGIKTVFPYQMAFDFDQLAINITGGAMLCTRNDERGDVYAMQGKSQNGHAVGTYSLFSEKRKQVGKLTTHKQKLIINGKAVEKSGVSADRLWWEGLSSAESDLTGLPASGFVEFSSGGHVIKGSSFGARGIRELANEQMAVGESNLLLQDLLGMNPYELSDGNMVDKVQQNAMEDFYKILQYYMPPKYLHDFIAANPPDVGEIRDIAEDDKAKNSKWYGSLSIPYLVQALSTSTDDAVKKLNARRAQSVLKNKTSTSEVYKDQAARLYSFEWQRKFPLMSQFLVDQQENATSHNPAIEKDAKKWIGEIKQDLDKSTDPDEQKQLQAMIDIAENARDEGKNGKYWAYIFFRYLSSPNYLTMLRMQLLDGNTSQTLSQDIQRYSAVLSILDPTSFFTELFVQVIGVFQLTSVLPSILDVPSNLDQFTFFMGKILEAFIAKYIDSKDPQMAEEARRVQEELKVHSLQSYLDLFSSVAATLGSAAWTNIAKAFASKAITKFGAGASYVANGLLLGAVSFGICLLATGTISWDELTPAQQAQFITQCVSVVVLLVRKGIEGVVAYQATGSLWEAMKVLFGKEIAASQELIGSEFGRWIARNHSTPTPSDLEILFNETVDFEAQFEETFPRLTTAFGRNLSEFMATRFAAAMAVVGIVLSAISLANSSTGLETAMNSLFLASATLDLVAAAAGWAVSLGAETIGALSIATIATCASGLAIAAAIAGVIILIIIMSKHKDPPDPVADFVNSDAVKEAGFFMKYNAAIDYFDVINDEEGKPRDLGISMQPDGSNDYMRVSSEGSLSLATMSYGYDTVLSVSTDYQGQSIFLTKVWNAAGKMKALALTLDDNKQLKMATAIDDDSKKSQQRWVAITVGDVTKDDKEHLVSAQFTIYNAYWGPSYYLNISGSSISVGSTAQNWLLKMQPMKPEKLGFQNITLTTFDKDRRFYPHLLQVGSISGQKWSVTPTLPQWLELDTSKGTISQKSAQAPPEYPQTSFTITVQNDVGSASTKFYIKVKKTF